MAGPFAAWFLDFLLWPSFKTLHCVDLKYKFKKKWGRGTVKTKMRQKFRIISNKNPRMTINLEWKLLLKNVRLKINWKLRKYQNYQKRKYWFINLKWKISIEISRMKIIERKISNDKSRMNNLPWKTLIHVGVNDSGKEIHWDCLSRENDEQQQILFSYFP